VRALVQREQDPRVRQIALQLLTLLEARGAPLLRDERGHLRTMGPDDAPQIVFHPSWGNAEAELEVGALWVELPDQTLLPLGQDVEVVDRVVPAFFDPTRSFVVFEDARAVRVRNVRTGETRTVSDGVGPRVIPFADAFVFLREIPSSRRDLQDGTVLEYEVLRASYRGGAPEPIGRLTVVARPQVHGGASPVRWMIVGEAAGGFVLRADGMPPFPLPGPFEAAPPPPTP